jgi:integrase
MRGANSIPGRKPKGRHPDKRLNAVRVRTTTKAGRYADGNGLYLVVDPSGARRWILRTVVSSKRCDVGLGGVALVSLAEARDEATRLRKIARAGGDPLAERRLQRRVVPTFAEAAKQVHAAHAATFRNAKHRAQWLASLEADVFPIFGDRRIDAIDSADVLKTLSLIWTKKPETARRLKQRIRVVLDWAKASGYRSGDNPVDGVTKVLPKQRQGKAHHAALPFDQVPGFLSALWKTNADEMVKLAFELTILCATRTSETLGAVWEEIDFERETWTIPGTRMKARVAHRVPLSRRCLEILERARVLNTGGPYVFSGRSPSKPLSNMAFLMTLRRMKRRDLTTHGFRSSFRDWAAERTNFPRAVCEAALAHVVQNKAEASYFRSDLFERRQELMNAWAAYATAQPADQGNISTVV